MSDEESRPHDPAPPSGPVGPHLWNVRAVRDVALALALIGTFELLVQMQVAVIPILIAFVLAYVLDPAISWVERQWGWSRFKVVGGMFVLLAGLNTLVFWLLVPRILTQIGRLAQRLPDYIRFLREEWGLEVPGGRGFESMVRDLASQEPGEIANFFGGAGQVVGTLTNVLGTTLSLVTATVLTLVVFAFFALRFPRLPSFQQYLPKSRRDVWMGRVRQVERVFAGFVRGQLLVVLFTTTVFSLGFALSGVPYWFVASVVGGAFSIIPYGQGVGWILAVSFNFFEAETASTNASLVAIFLGPTITYAAMQSLETFVVTPLVQGSSVKLHPVAVLVAVIAGGSFGGLIGVFLAIPLAAVARIFMLEIALPALRNWAERH